MNAESAVQDKTVQDKQPSGTTPPSGPYYRPDVDVTEWAEELLIVADMPGLAADGISIDFEQGTLTIHGRVAAQEPQERSHLLHEFGVGDYFRVFRVGEQIDASKIRADYNSGVLTVHLPKVAAAQPRKIKVDAGS